MEYNVYRRSSCRCRPSNRLHRGGSCCCSRGHRCRRYRPNARLEYLGRVNIDRRRTLGCHCSGTQSRTDDIQHHNRGHILPRYRSGSLALYLDKVCTDHRRSRGSCSKDKWRHTGETRSNTRIRRRPLHKSSPNQVDLLGRRCTQRRSYRVTPPRTSRRSVVSPPRIRRCVMSNCTFLAEGNRRHSHTLRGKFHQRDRSNSLQDKGSPDNLHGFGTPPPDRLAFLHMPDGIRHNACG